MNTILHPSTMDSGDNSLFRASLDTRDHDSRRARLIPGELARQLPIVAQVHRRATTAAAPTGVSGNFSARILAVGLRP